MHLLLFIFYKIHLTEGYRVVSTYIPKRYCSDVAKKVFAISC